MGLRAWTGIAPPPAAFFAPTPVRPGASFALDFLATGRAQISPGVSIQTAATASERSRILRVLGSWFTGTVLAPPVRETRILFPEGIEPLPRHWSGRDQAIHRWFFGLIEEKPETDNRVLYATYIELSGVRTGRIDRIHSEFQLLARGMLSPGIPDA